MDAVLNAEQVRELRDSLVGGRLPQGSHELVDVIAALEELKSAIGAVQAEATVAFDAVRRSEQAAAGVPAARQGRGIAAEVALARRESPHRGQVHLGLAKVLHAEMPHALARLKDGGLDEFRALLVARETGCLSAEQRLFVDEELFADPAVLAGEGARRLLTRVRRMVAELDPAAVARRARRAEADRHVSIRPAPDTMTYVTGLLPVAQGVAVIAALTKEAAAMRAAGDPRSKGQLMSDLMVARITGLPLSGAGSSGGEQVPPPPVPVCVNITVADTALAGGHAPAEVSADGVPPEVVPAEVARLLVSRGLDAGVGAWFRKLYVNPLGRLVAMTSRQRSFPEGLATFLAQRGLGICSTPWCDAPVRHCDHVVPVDEGGRTTEANGQGLCEACNHAKQATGWSQQVATRPGERHRVETITPSGHRYLSTVPPPVGWREPRFVRTRPGVFTLIA
ncbi:DUF222 domain-containing protein [Nocardioides sp. SYSU DS0651]|uniref:HNH endonuclease n=1 Tax=Nocardioides sp. SYSU DS0651 TaxID=3415955 RepID=UPI003F4BF1F3